MHALAQLTSPPTPTSAPIWQVPSTPRPSQSPVPATSPGWGSEPVPVEGVSRDICVKIASEPHEWEQAYRLVAKRYVEKGYSPPQADGMHFTAFHVLPSTITLVAMEDDVVLATATLVADNPLMGIPIEYVYGEEIRQFRRDGRNLSEVTCLADSGLDRREFVRVFMALCRLLVRFKAVQGDMELVIEVHPRHVKFYRRVWGFDAFGTVRPCPSVQDHPAVGLFLDDQLIRENAPSTYDFVYHQPIPDGALDARPMPVELVREFAAASNKIDLETADEILYLIACQESPAAW